MKKTTKLLYGMVMVLVIAFVIAFVTPTLATNNSVDSKYRVFCANNKVEVEQRTLEQQKNARGSNVCQLGEFDYLSDADKFAEKLGGKGADCKCD